MIQAFRTSPAQLNPRFGSGSEQHTYDFKKSWESLSYGTPIPKNLQFPPGLNWEKLEVRLIYCGPVDKQLGYRPALGFNALQKPAFGFHEGKLLSFDIVQQGDINVAVPRDKPIRDTWRP